MKIHNFGGSSITYSFCIDLFFKNKVKIKPSKIIIKWIILKNKTTARVFFSSPFSIQQSIDGITHALWIESILGQGIGKYWNVSLI